MSIHDIISYSTCPFESGKCGKEGKKIQKSEYLENEKSFLDEIRNIFYSFRRAINWSKNKNLIKNSRQALGESLFFIKFVLQNLTVLES